MGSKVIFKVLIFLIVVLGLGGCDRDPYHGFGCIAPESHQAVEWPRSLSPEQLQTVYIEAQKLNRIHSQENYETQFLKSEIPESLGFLNAEMIRVYHTRVYPNKGTKPTTGNNGILVSLGCCFPCTLSPLQMQKIPYHLNETAYAAL